VTQRILGALHVIHIEIRASDDPDIRDGAPAARELQNFIRSRIVQFWPHISDDSLALLVKKFLPLCQRKLNSVFFMGFHIKINFHLPSIILKAILICAHFLAARH
jgi:hypothetical protein